MKGRTTIVIGLILTFCLAVLPLFSAPAAAEEPMAKIIKVGGTVWARSEIKAPLGEWVLIKTGEYPLYSGDTVKTSGGRTEIFFHRDQSVISLVEDTQVLLRQTEEKGTILRRIFVSLGWVCCTVNPRTGLETQIESNAATAVVRGAMIQYWLDSAGTAFVPCIDGGIDVKANGVTIHLLPGQCTRVTPGSVPAPPFDCVAPPCPTVEGLEPEKPAAGGPAPVLVAPSPLFQGTGGGGIASPHK